MEENSLVKEISPEEVKSIDPYEISYIAMKDGSIMMIIDKNENMENTFKIQKTIIKNNEKSEIKEKSEQDSPDFNLKGKKSKSFINTNNETKQREKDIENEVDYNVYYSNTKNKSDDITKDNANIDNISFYSNDDIHKKENNNMKVEYEYTNGNKEYNTNIENNINNIGNKAPYCIVKRKYYFYKKSDHKNKPKKEGNNLRKAYSYNITSNTPKKRQNNNIYILRTHSINNSNTNYNNDNLILKNSKYSIDNNIKNININNTNHKRNSDYKYQFRTSKSKTNSICTCTCGSFSQRSSNNYPETNNSNMHTINDTNINNTNNDYYDNYNYYDHKPKIEKFEINDYSYKKYNNHTVHSILSSKNDNLTENRNSLSIKAKTPSYTMRDMKKKGNKDKKANKKNNLELKKCLSKDNHKYYERKELSAPKKTKSNYIQMKDSNGNTLHVFENK